MWALLGIVLSAAWLGAVYWWLREEIGLENIGYLLPSEIGQFLAGIVAPLALIWILIAYLRNGAALRRLRDSVAELRDEILHREALSPRVSTELSQASEGTRLTAVSGGTTEPLAQAEPKSLTTKGASSEGDKTGGTPAKEPSPKGSVAPASPAQETATAKAATPKTASSGTAELSPASPTVKPIAAPVPAKPPAPLRPVPPEPPLAPAPAVAPTAKDVGKDQGEGQVKEVKDSSSADTDGMAKTAEVGVLAEEVARNIERLEAGKAPLPSPALATAAPEKGERLDPGLQVQLRHIARDLNAISMDLSAVLCRKTSRDEALKNYNRGQKEAFHVLVRDHLSRHEPAEIMARLAQADATSLLHTYAMKFASLVDEAKRHDASGSQEEALCQSPMGQLYQEVQRHTAAAPGPERG